jgi:catechol 2,3-dioxygenase-like lactoylglutathione lyase family enzyme
MTITEVPGTSRDAAAGNVDMHFEVDIIPVSDVDRSKQFYQRLGWRLDADVAPLDGLRIVQFTPPGSAASVNFGTGPAALASRQHDDQDAAALSPCAPGRLRGLRAGAHGQLADYHRSCSMRYTMLRREG